MLFTILAHVSRSRWPHPNAHAPYSGEYITTGTDQPNDACGDVQGKLIWKPYPFITPVSNGQDKGWTRIADSCIAENRLEKLATNPDTFNEAPASVAWGLGGVRALNEERQNERSEGEGEGSGSFAAGGGAEPH